MPGGMVYSMVCAMATICARPVWMFALGWKNTLTTPTPLVLCDSICSMSLTVAVIARSNEDTTRASNSSEDRPV